MRGKQIILTFKAGRPSP